MAAAGRCTFCNRLVLDNEDLGETIKIGQLAHNVGWGPNSPRGDDELPPELRQEAENLILACGSCHKPIDAGGVELRYTVEELKTRKIEHEVRIRELTAIGADRAAFVVRVVGKIRTVNPELSYETVLDAATKAGIYPQRLTGSHRLDVDLDLTPFGDPVCKADFESMLKPLRQLCDRVHDGVRVSDIRNIAVFGFARIPLLIELGARLDDKLTMQVFNRHRVDGGNPWTWPSEDLKLELETTQIREGRDPSRVALLV